jgi:hypothetical protein
MKIRRRLVLALAALAAGCASEFKPLKFPDPVPLVNPASGMGVVYFIRTANDNASINIFLNGLRTVVLPKETYTAVQLLAGKYEIAAGERGALDETAQATLVLAAGERRFIYTTQPSSRRNWPAFIPVVGALLPLVINENSPDGARRLFECNEFDAQSFFTILTAVTPERNAP